MIPLPCPWCGLEWRPLTEVEAEAQDAHSSHARSLNFWEGYNNPYSSKTPHDYSTAVHCPRCKAIGPEVPGDGPAEKLTNEAVRLWNERKANAHV